MMTRDDIRTAERAYSRLDDAIRELRDICKEDNLEGMMLRYNRGETLKLTQAEVAGIMLARTQVCIDEVTALNLVIQQDHRDVMECAGHIAGPNSMQAVRESIRTAQKLLALAGHAGDYTSLSKGVTAALNALQTVIPMEVK